MYSSRLAASERQRATDKQVRGSRESHHEVDRVRRISRVCAHEPPITAPTMPIIAVTPNPPGSRPSIRPLRRPPTKPNTIHPRTPMR